jgi:hypothetical protein
MYAELARKRCTKCGAWKPLKAFQPDKRYALDVKSRCRLCLNEYCREKGFAAKYAARNKEKVRAYQKQWRIENKERYDASRRRWVRNNLKRVLVETRKYQAAKLKRKPKWLTKDQMDAIQTLYERCPNGFEVDHIVPLQGKSVSGLHVPWNLQYLRRSQNRRKANKC